MIRIGIAGLIGYETAERLLDDNFPEMTARFSSAFIKKFRKLKAELLVNDWNSQEPQMSAEEELPDILPGVIPDEDIYAGRIGEGGLWAALWEACEYRKNSKDSRKRKRSGCRIDLNDIKIPQEIIEISELFDENPYEAASPGALLLVWDEDAAGKMNAEIRQLIDRASVIGCMTEENQRILTDGEMTRFLTPPDRQKKDISDRRSYSSCLRITES